MQANPCIFVLLFASLLGVFAPQGNAGQELEKATPHTELVHTILPNKRLLTEIHFVDSALAACVRKTAKKHGWQFAADVTSLKCHAKNIKSARGLEVLVSLEKLSLYNNAIDTFDARPYSVLQSLNLAKNALVTFDIEDMPELRELYLFGNRLRTLSTDNLPKLQKIKANNNRLLRYTYQNLPHLKKSYFFNNKLKFIDVDNLPKLKYMDVRQNPMPDELYEDMDEMDGVTILHDGNAEDWQ